MYLLNLIPLDELLGSLGIIGVLHSLPKSVTGVTSASYGG
jgi:hypothetical protein